MNQFDLYMPGLWVEDGLLVRVTKKVTEVLKRQVRSGQWTVKPMLPLATCAITAALLLQNVPTVVEDVGVVSLSADQLNSKRAMAPEDQLVPEGYFLRLGAAVKSIARLPEQDISNDPPIMV